MVNVHLCKNFVILISNSSLKAFDLSEGKDGALKEISFVNALSSNQDQAETESKDQKYYKDPHRPTGQVLASCLSSSEKYFAVCTDWKELSVFQPRDGWKQLLVRTTQKRCTAICFHPTESQVFVADKFGDVYSFSLSQPESGEVLQIGHFSMLLDMVISSDGRFLITSDRDEKIRVSCLPNAYNIHSFCLGHTEFVSRCKLLPSLPNVLVSGGGDSTLRFWDYEAGQQVSCLQIKPSTNESKESMTITCMACSQQRNLIAVCLLKQSRVLVYKVSSSTSDELIVSEVTTLQLTSSPWCTAFDHWDRLWVIESKAGDTVQVFQIEEIEDNIQFKRFYPASDDALSTVLADLNGDWAFFKESLETGCLYTTLHKKNFDNMQHYAVKKQLRIEDQNKRRKKQQEKSGQERATPTQSETVT